MATGRAPRRIFVGALPKKLGEDAFRKHFEQFGELIDVELMRRPGDTRNRGFGFVKYTSTEVSEKVIGMTHNLEGQKLTVNYAKVPLPQDTKRFFIGAINKDAICEADLTNYFSAFGTVEDCVIMKEKNFGFVAIFNSDHSRLDAVLNETHVINGETLEIEAAKPKPTRNRVPVKSIRKGKDGYGGRGGGRFGGPQRFNPYGGHHPRGPPHMGHNGWGPPPPHMGYGGFGHPPPYGEPPMMRNPEYETFDKRKVKPPNTWGNPGGNRAPQFQGPGNQYNPQRDAGAAYGGGYGNNGGAPPPSGGPPSYGNVPPPASHGPPGGHGATPNTYTSYGAPPPQPSTNATGAPSSAPAPYGNSYTPYNNQNQYNQQPPTYNQPPTQAPSSNANPYPAAPPTGAPTNYPNSQPPVGQQNYQQPPPGGYQQQPPNPYSQNTYTSYSQPPTY